MSKTIRTLLAAGLAAALTPLAGTAAFASPPTPPPKVTILSPHSPLTIAMNRTLTLKLKVSGVSLSAAHIGKKPSGNEGHIQVYLDAIPKDAYKKADLKHNWLASVAATTFPMKLTSGVLGGKKGIHKILVTLAKNNNVLYVGKVATLKLTVK
jgi:hypothetical protein